MHLIGLAGPAGAGKDMVADLLIHRHGWHKFSFGDALYAEVSQAFGIAVRDLKDPTAKETPTDRLALMRCEDQDFVDCQLAGVGDEYLAMALMSEPLSPRYVLQRWGTDYRRDEDPDYWVRRAADTYSRCASGENPPPGLANTSTRFPNEVRWIREEGGVVVHIERPGCEPESDYVSERPVPWHPGDYRIANDAGLETLHQRVDALADWLDMTRNVRRGPLVG